MKKDVNKDKTTMTAREVAVLIEDLGSQFRAFGDELKTITRRLDGIEITVARTWEKLTEIDLRLIRVEKKLEEIDKRLTVVESPK
jgi:tetrahydromethanopterin S-methyltransferase subunit G